MIIYNLSAFIPLLLIAVEEGGLLLVLDKLLKEISESVGSYQTSVKNLSTSKAKDTISISESESKMSRAIYTVDELRNFKFGNGLYLESGKLPASLKFTPFYRMPIQKDIAKLKQREVDEKRVEGKINE